MAKLKNHLALSIPLIFPDINSFLQKSAANISSSSAEIN